jgi:hypothetical protein
MISRSFVKDIVELFRSMKSPPNSIKLSKLILLGGDIKMPTAGYCAAIAKAQDMGIETWRTFCFAREPDGSSFTQS